MTTIPDAAIEALLEHVGITDPTEQDREQAAATVRLIAEHLTPAPPAECDVRDALARVLDRLHFNGTGCATSGSGACSNCHGPSPMDAHEVADAVLASGLVVPVGEVGRVERMRAETYDLMVKAQADANAAEAERDNALAKVEALRAVLYDWIDRSTGPSSDEYVALVNGGRLEVIRAVRDTLNATAPAPSRLPARLLNGSHVGRVVRLPDGTEGIIRFLDHGVGSIDREHFTRIWVAKGVETLLAPDDVVELVDPAVDGSDS